MWSSILLIIALILTAWIRTTTQAVALAGVVVVLMAGNTLLL